MAKEVVLESVTPFTQHQWAEALDDGQIINHQVDGLQAAVVPAIDGFDGFVDPAADREHVFTGGFDSLERQLRVNADFYQALGISAPSLRNLSEAQVARLSQLGPLDRVLLVPHLSQKDRTTLTGLASIAFGGMDVRLPLVSGRTTRAGYLLENPSDSHTEITGMTKSFRRDDLTPRPSGHFNQSTKTTTTVLRYR